MPVSPVLKGSWRYSARRKADRNSSSTRSSPAKPYRLPLEIGISTEACAQPRIEKIEIKDRQAHFEHPDRQATGIGHLDPNRSVLAKITFAPAPVVKPVSAPPEDLGLDPFYTKYVSAHGLPIVGSAKVSDNALREAAYLVDQMLVASARNS